MRFIRCPVHSPRLLENQLCVQGRDVKFNAMANGNARKNPSRLPRAKVSEVPHDASKMSRYHRRSQHSITAQIDRVMAVVANDFFKERSSRTLINNVLDCVCPSSNSYRRLQRFIGRFRLFALTFQASSWTHQLGHLSRRRQLCHLTAISSIH